MASPFPFGGKVPELLDKSDLDSLLADPPTLEGRFLEYRLPTFVNAPADAQSKAQIRMLRTVSAFANTEGGYVVYGIKEQNGVPKTLRGLPDEEIDGFMLKAVDALRDNLSPTVPDIRIAPVALNDDQSAVVLHIPASARRPHMVEKGEYRCYKRDANRNTPADIEDLRRMFVSAGRTGLLRYLSQELRQNAESETRLGLFPVLLRSRALDQVLPFVSELPEHLRTQMDRIALGVNAYNSVSSIHLEDARRISERNTELINKHETLKPKFIKLAESIDDYLDDSPKSDEL